LKTGFSYTPELLSNSGIAYYNLYWEDLTVPSFALTIKICQLIHFHVVQGGIERSNKIFIHCHAGKGRTAIIAASYLLWCGIAKTSEDAIQKCKQARKKMFSGFGDSKKH
jgi:protein-tyrosine phosphatase